MTADLALCPDCRTPVAVWKGSAHGWRCRQCIDRVVGISRNVIHTTESST